MNIDPSVCARGLPRDPQGRHHLHPLVARAAEALETAGVTWALLRGEYDLGDPRGDVDILVDSPRGLGAVEQALRPLGVVAVPQVGAGAHRLFVGYHRPTRRWIEFDVEWDLDFGSQMHFTLNWLAPALRSGAARAVLARRQRSPDLPGMWVLHPDDAFWALLLHVIIDKGTVKDHHADRLVALCAGATPSGPLAQVVADVCPPGWDVDRVIGCTRARQWSTLVALGRVLARRSCTRHPVAHRTGALVRGLHRLGRSLWPVLATRGVSVAVVGSNGAGRSALVAGLLSERLLAARLVHPGLAEESPKGPGPVRRPPAGTAGRRLLAWRCRLVAAYHRRRGRTVVFDALPAGFRVRVDPRPDVVIVVEPRSPLTRDVLADAVAAVWRARSGYAAGCELRTGARVMRTMPGTSTTATTDCVAR